MKVNLVYIATNRVASAFTENNVITLMVLVWADVIVVIGGMIVNKVIVLHKSRSNIILFLQKYKLKAISGCYWKTGFFNLLYHEKVQQSVTIYLKTFEKSILQDIQFSYTLTVWTSLKK